jgi:hypothetical protein
MRRAVRLEIEGQNPHFLQKTREMGHPARKVGAVAVWVAEKSKVEISASRKGREKQGTRPAKKAKVKIPTRRKLLVDIGARRRTGVSAPYRTGMDITWLTDRIAVGGGIWNSDNMAKVAQAGITHIIDMQIEFDDTELGLAHGVEVLWNPTDDDFEAKPPELFRRGVDFALAALEGMDAKVFIHCAAGVHRAPMMALALLGSMGWTLEDAMLLIEGRREVADFADVYVRSVEAFLGVGE